jgi:hypothetical protein
MKGTMADSRLVEEFRSRRAAMTADREDLRRRVEAQRAYRDAMIAANAVILQTAMSTRAECSVLLDELWAQRRG